MATLTEYPIITTSASPLSDINATYDHEFDSFLDLDQFNYPTSTSESAKGQPALATQSSVASSEIPFPGPSHQYDDHLQQTGLPPGGLAQAMSFNRSTGMAIGAGHRGFAVNGDRFSPSYLKQEESMVDFGTAPTRNPSEMDLEADSLSPVPPFFMPSSNNTTQFVDPNALGEREVSPIPPPVGRMYPGMHSQQAALARAAQQKQRQQQQQQQKQQQQRNVDEQTQQAGRQQNRGVRPVDPAVEERISRLLQQMRQKSASQNEDASSPTSLLPQIARMKKDEDDMDEDERLLASEEGKKLSSKERRQLRNKVSARAFRSRRKEYIGQLEGEVAAKTTESTELRLQNRAILEENARLTDLIRMLLSSPHFSSVLNDLSMNGPPPQFQVPQQQPPTVTQPSLQPNARRDVPTTQDFPLQQNFHVGMVTVPEPRMNLSPMDVHPGWNSGIDLNFTHTPVFAVLDVPEGPALDTELLSGKALQIDFTPSESAKDELPCLDRPPVYEIPRVDSKVQTPCRHIENDTSDPALSLFLDTKPAPSKTPPKDLPRLLRSIVPDKYSHDLTLIVKNDSADLSESAVQRFEQLCSSMEAAFQRVSLVTSHLS